MRFLIVAVLLASALAFASGAYAQTAPQSSAPAAPSGGTGGGLQTERPAAPGEVCRLSGRRTRAGLRSPIPTSLVRAVLYFRTVALLASAAPHHAGGASVSIEATPTIRDRAARRS